MTVQVVLCCFFLSVNMSNCLLRGGVCKGGGEGVSGENDRIDTKPQNKHIQTL